MFNAIFSKFIDILRSRIRFARYSQSINLFQHNPHPVTLGPEQLSRFFTYVANNERARF